jgi:hypothetical protein
MATQTSQNVEHKTSTNQKNVDGDSTSSVILKSKKKLLPNVLNNYRNVTYNFTISVVPDQYLDDAKYRFVEPKYIILKSGGKGSKDFALPDSLSKLQLQTVEDAAYIENEKAEQLYIDKVSKKQLENTQGLISGFNKESPGRFDLFIDDVEIQGIMTPGTSNGASLASKISFTVIEPYSINGFIEALHVASLGAGYTTYANAAYLMKIEFWGYRDDVDVSVSTPEKIDRATKFLLFGLSSVKVELTHQGTKYQCTGVMYTDRAMGNPNKLSKPISMEGATVKEILEDLCKNLEKQIQQTNNESNPGENKNYDRYEIKFPTLENGIYNFSGDGNSIGKSKVSEFNKSNVLSPMPNLASTANPTVEEAKQNPNILKYSPTTNIKVQFNAGRNLNECIEAVIVDSEYVQGLLKNFKPDSNGLVNYFLITPKVTNLDIINPQAKDYYKKYTYIVTEYKIHYTRVPGYRSYKFNVNDITNIIYKEYNYTYTGKNIDVLNFRLDFNNLFYESIPFALGNTDVFGVRNGASPSDNTKVEYDSESLDKVALHPIPVQPIKTDPTDINPKTAGTGGQLIDDPYQILARNLHEAVINAGVSGAQGDLEILGDPFFISTTGTGNYKAKLEDGYVNVTVDNEIDSTFGEVYIIVIFRNPVDVNQFQKIRAPFSGVYMITTVKSLFKNGVFKQEFKLIRVPAQLPIGDSTKSSDVTLVSVTSPNPSDQTVADTTPAISGPGIRPDPTQLSIPTVNNPTYSLSGKVTNPVAQGMSLLSAASSVYSLSNSRLSEGIRLAATTISAPLEQLSKLKSSAETLGSLVGNQKTALDNAMSTFANNSTVGNLVKGLANTNGLVNGIQNKIEGATKEQSLDSLAKTLGIDVNNLTALGKEKLEGLKSKANELSINIPRASGAGLQLNTIPLEKLKNIPLLAPATTAPAADIPLQDVKGLNIANAFGVTDLTKLPGGITPDKINYAINEVKDIGGKLVSLKTSVGTDVSALRDKFGSVNQQVTAAVGQLSQNLESAQASLGSVNTKSVINVFGSKSASSPLDKLVTGIKQSTNIPPGS